MQVRSGGWGVWEGGLGLWEGVRGWEGPEGVAEGHNCLQASYTGRAENLISRDEDMVTLLASSSKNFFPALSRKYCSKLVVPAVSEVAVACWTVALFWDTFQS